VCNNKSQTGAHCSLDILYFLEPSNDTLSNTTTLTTNSTTTNNITVFEQPTFQTVVTSHATNTLGYSEDSFSESDDNNSSSSTATTTSLNFTSSASSFSESDDNNSSSSTATTTSLNFTSSASSFSESDDNNSSSTVAVDASSNTDEDEDDVIADELWKSIKRNLTLNQKHHNSHNLSWASPVSSSTKSTTTTTKKTTTTTTTTTTKSTTTSTTMTTTTSSLPVSLKVFDFGPFIIGIKPGQYDPEDYTLVKEAAAQNKPIQIISLNKTSKVCNHIYNLVKYNEVLGIYRNFPIPP
jgi:hypothetical protein